MECRDEAEANNAFKEAKALQELQHPYICGYRENFVSWDREEGAMFVCIVMEYYPLKDLEVGELPGSGTRDLNEIWIGGQKSLKKLFFRIQPFCNLGLPEKEAREPRET